MNALTQDDVDLDELVQYLPSESLISESKQMKWVCNRITDHDIVRSAPLSLMFNTLLWTFYHVPIYLSQECQIQKLLHSQMSYILHQ